MNTYHLGIWTKMPSSTKLTTRNNDGNYSVLTPPHKKKIIVLSECSARVTSRGMRVYRNTTVMSYLIEQIFVSVRRHIMPASLKPPLPPPFVGPDMI